MRFTQAARESGYRYLCMNDHLVFPRPWLDGPTALAAVLQASGDMRLATTVALPVVRGPVALAKTLAAIDRLSEGRLVIGVGPGSSARDYAAVGVPFEERWPRLDESVRALRALLAGTDPEGPARFYTLDDVRLEPPPAQRPAPPIWIGSWGSEAGLRRVARLGDGWIASGYNTTPELFATALAALNARLAAAGREASTFPNALATTWMYVTEDRATARRMLEEALQPALGRDVEELRARTLIGSAEECAQKVSAFARAGLQQLFIWPLGDEAEQIEAFQTRVAPLVPSARS